MKIVYSGIFLKAAKQLPNPQQKKLARLLSLLSSEPFHPSLHTKRLSGSLSGFLSFRITRDWRVTFIFLNQDTIQLVGVAHRKDIYC